ncbi:Uncharacterised protein [uncultured archaeon]|nr:Uncharacterised protein [uncultured archaeon]
MDPLTFQALWTAWAPVAGLVVFVSLLVTVLIYLIGKALNNEAMAGWARSEVYQVMASAAIIGLVVSALLIANTSIFVLLGDAQFRCTQNTCSYEEVRFSANADTGTFDNIVKDNWVDCGADNPCQISIAKSRLNTLYDLVRYWTAGKVEKYGIVSIVSSLQIGLKGVFKVSPFSVGEYLKETYNIMFEFTTTMLLLLKSQVILLTVIEKALFGLFLVGGIALRSIGITRKLGGLLIALALGAYFFYPMVIILTTLVISPTAGQMPVVFDDFSYFTTPPISADSSYGTDIGIPGSATIDSGDASAQPETGNEVNTAYVHALTSDAEINGKSYNMITYNMLNVIQPNGFIDNVAFLSVWIMAITVIVIYSTVTFIKELSPYFGGDTDIAGLARMI